MASKANSGNATPAARLDELDNYFLDGDLDDDPFASPKSDSNKRKGPGDGLGLDEEVSVAKKARVPRIKLDQERLLSQKGIPALRRRAKDLKLKGKGHEWGDASRLLSFYQGWLDDLFPKAKFLDALAMVEKAGHNKQLQRMRVEWINEGKPKASVVDDGADLQVTEDDQLNGDAPPRQSERIAPIFEKAASGGPETPDLDDLFGEEDIYGATPVGARKKSAAIERGGEPDDDELDALLAETEANGLTRPSKGAYQSIFGGGKPGAGAPPMRVAEEHDDLDALLAEAEAEQPTRQDSAVIMAQRTEKAPKAQAPEAPARNEDDDDGDLDALMAEAEASTVPAKPSGSGMAAAKQTDPGFDDEEEAMAEMDGLW